MFYSSLMSGSNSHKRIDLAGNPVLRYYYTDRVSQHFPCTTGILYLKWKMLPS